MSDHRLFYFPYASFTDAQLPLLKVAALYFDKLIFLDPVDASWGTVGAGVQAREAVRSLAEAGLLERVSPAEVLDLHAAHIAEAVRRDMRDEEFLELCDRHADATGRRRWTLALAKVPNNLGADRTLQTFMGEFAREISGKTAYATGEYIEHREALASLPGDSDGIPLSLYEREREYAQYQETGHAFDEVAGGYEGTIEYRYADFPIALGEALMVNHALFAGLLHAGATPVTDELFHARALATKLYQAALDPVVRDARLERGRANQVRADLLGVAAFTDYQLNLPVIDPSLPLDLILRYREEHADELEQVRAALGLMARRIEGEPWTEEFAAELEHKAVPDLGEKLAEARAARDACLRTQHGRLALAAAGVTTAAVSAVLTVVAAPVTPVALAIAGTAFTSGSVVPGLQWLLDWRAGKGGVQENGLQYLVKMPTSES